MGQEIISVLRRKDTPRVDGYKKEIATIDYVCGRGELQDVIVHNLVWDDNQEFVITKENIAKLNEVLSELAFERDKTEEELDKGISKIREKTILSVSAQNKEIAKEAEEYADNMQEYIKDAFWDDFYLATHLMNLISTTKSITEDLLKEDKSYLDESRKDLEVAIILSY